MKHLRLYFYDETGEPIGTGNISAAMMPLAPVGSSVARELVGPHHDLRRHQGRRALVDLMEQCGFVRGIALISCPSRASRERPDRRLTPQNSYRGSLIVIAKQNQIWQGDRQEASLEEILEWMDDAARWVLSRGTDEVGDGSAEPDDDGRRHPRRGRRSR